MTTSRLIHAANRTGASIRELLERQGGEAPDRTAIESVGGDALRYRDLVALADTARAVRASVCAHSPRAPVALVVPNGPEAATSFLAFAASGAVAPLNPSYTRNELQFSIDDLRPGLLAVDARLDSPARHAARTAGIPIVELEPVARSGGAFRPVRDSSAVFPRVAPRDGRDIALLLHTSGTTSRPKLVGLTNGRVAGSAAVMADTMRLGADDRGLGTMPLFHGHGLMMLVAAIASGGSYVCAPGFEPQHFFEWLVGRAVTYYSASPTIHQAVVARAPADAQLVSRSRLRFVRSASSPLPPAVHERLERIFNAPVIECYGMTEGTHQIACNPLPPGARKAGSVGLPTGTRIAVLSDDGTILAAGGPGEIVVKGPMIVEGYVDNPAADAEAFRDGWFRTGDSGRIDDEGYVFLEGRLKEIINRGGEKIAPREVDEALLAHPSVAEAMAFPMPHPTLGEEVAAAVVLGAGASADESDLRRFAATRLAPFKVPRRVWIVEELPKGPTGKPRRADAMQQLAPSDPGVDGDATRPPFVAPFTPLERLLASLWSEVLGCGPAGLDDDFVSLGGDSIAAADIASRVSADLGRPVSPAMVLEHPTVRAQALAILAALLGAAPDPDRSPSMDRSEE
jgi:acyl-CoA synthetase (AMP-forming)/AMP-acid ligase II